MKLQGQIIQKRGSNKKYPFLDDLDALYEALKEKSIGELAREWNVPQNSIRTRVMNHFPDEWFLEMKIDRLGKEYEARVKRAKSKLKKR